MGHPYTTYRSYLKNRFGKPVLKIPINAGFSCPNRDGTKSDTGCTFCDNRSFSPVALNSSSVVSQLSQVIQRASDTVDLFIPYLQPFTNTYGSVEQLTSVYEPLIALPGVIGLAVGTRPDCLSGEICDYLADIARRTYLSVEIGLQSASDEVLGYNNRGHTFADFKEAVGRLAEREIEVVAHVMIGLPKDTRAKVVDTAQELARLPVHGIKLHQLMIIKDTRMEEWYNREEVTPLELEEYAVLAGEFIICLRPDQCIHRIMADSKPEYGLIAPLWSAEKMKSVECIKRYMQENELFQGKQYKK
jgi:radical SAM protein (TIGR01212 family)